MLTLQGEKLGTPAYMAPEQATGRIDEIDERTDVYGLAAILYEILTGEPPFLGKSLVEVLDHVIHVPPKPPNERGANVPPALERICLQGLSKKRDARQHTALELAEQVQCWIAERAERKRTEQERERFFNLSLDLLAILDAKGTLTQTNPAWKTILGWDEAAIEGKTVWQVIHPDDHELVTRNLARILAGESLTAVEHRCLCEDGSHRWVLWNARLIAGEGAIYIVGRDITERKQTEQTFQELLESAPDGMVIVNQTGQIVLVNMQLERQFGFSREEMLGQPIEILVPAQFRAKHPEYVARFVASPDFRPMASGLKLHGQRKDGSVFPVEISLSPVKTEQGMLVSCAVRDVARRQVHQRGREIKSKLI
jgi:PAS domain S-box-containing protein